MAKVIIKDVNRKTTISKAAIKKAAAIAYGLKPSAKPKPSPARSGKPAKAA